MPFYISYGAGINSTAMTLLLLSKGLRFPVVFADTGGEWPETYDFIRVFKEFLQRHFDITLHIVKKSPPLYDYLLSLGSIPSLKNRWCTDRWKARPIRKAYPNRIPIIGWTLEEARRIRKAKGEFWAPLYEIGMTRQHCIKVIQKFGLPVPIKSACWFCPFQSKRRWQILRQRHPDLFRKALELEKRNKETKGVKWGYKIDRSLLEFLGKSYQMSLPFLKP